MKFKEWFALAEAILDPKILKAKVLKIGDQSHLRREINLVIDKNGKVVEYDFAERRPYLTIKRNGSIDLHKLSPQSKEFRQIINALRPVYPDIDSFPVRHYFMALHMQGANDRDRTVGYWMKRQEVRLANKMPKYFYHGTSTNLWYDGIKENGLLPRRASGSSGTYGAQNIQALSQDDLVYVAADPDAATRTAAEQAAKKHGGMPLIIRIDTTGLDPDRLSPDEDTKASTAQASVDIGSTLAYKGRISASNLEPFLIGKINYDKQYKAVKWTRFEDVPMAEHPLTTRLKKGETPYSEEPEYYALLDAGIIGKEKDGYGYQHVVTDKNITDEKIRSILKNARWTQNVKAILKDLADGYSGNFTYLRGLVVPEEVLQEKWLKMILDSELFRFMPIREKDLKYFPQLEKPVTLENNSTYDSEEKAIKLAKMMGNITLPSLFEKIKKLYEKYKRES
jgi:hypothetical protein